MSTSDCVRERRGVDGEEGMVREGISEISKTRSEVVCEVVCEGGREVEAGEGGVVVDVDATLEGDCTGKVVAR